MTPDSTTRATGAANAKSDTKLPVAMTGKASPAKAVEDDGSVFAYIAGVCRSHSAVSPSA